VHKLNGIKRTLSVVPYPKKGWAKIFIECKKLCHIFISLVLLRLALMHCLDQMIDFWSRCACANGWGSKSFFSFLICTRTREYIYVYPFKVTLISLLSVCMWEVLKFVESYEIEKEEVENIGKTLHVSEINLFCCWTTKLL